VGEPHHHALPQPYMNHPGSLPAQLKAVGNLSLQTGSEGPNLISCAAPHSTCVRGALWRSYIQLVGIFEKILFWQVPWHRAKLPYVDQGAYEKNLRKGGNDAQGR
jgi:hypothetical protein